MNYFLNYLDKEILKYKSENNAVNCAVISSGCKLNQFESYQFESLFKNSGINVIESFNINKINENKVHIFLINTCSVTEKADNETRRIINKIKKNYPLSTIILTGCFAQLNKETYVKAEYQNAGIKLIDNIQKLDILTRYTNKKDKNIFSPAQKRIRANLKIQEGCDIKCAFCIIPQARPIHWSLDFKEVLSSIEEFYNAGFKEIIISGMNIGSYRSFYEESGANNDNNNSCNDYYNNDSNNKKIEKNFNSLLLAIEELNFPVKIRISSIDPIHINDDLINILANSKKIQNHFHIPLQSGSNKILNLMKRNYTFEEYFSVIDKINSKVKDAAIGTDIISGFPGETEEDFNETVNNLNKLDIYYMHVFSYSDRKGTEAFLMEHKINQHTIKQRTSILRNISLRKKNIFQRKFYGKVLDFLSLSDNKAISSNYIKANILKDKDKDKDKDKTVLPNTFFKGILIEQEDAVKSEKEDVFCKIC
ncbi:MAG: MiaB/RimO family radical SAM methylthiotransferase [Deltaproteobacteria bacterium]|nr:MiaB/RimO family radical SAM methylthiotransferase [Deltaproteobacteria bacterium]